MVVQLGEAKEGEIRASDHNQKADFNIDIEDFYCDYSKTNF